MKRIIIGIALLGMLQGCTPEKDSMRSDIPIRLAVTINNTPTAQTQTRDAALTFEANLYRWDYKGEDESWKTQRPQESTLTCNASSTGQITFQSSEELYYTTDSDGAAYETALLSITPRGEVDDTHQSMAWHADQCNGQQDVMVASLIQVGNINNPQPGKLVFRHQLSQFNFQVVRRSSSQVGTLRQLVLKSVKLPQKISLLADNPITYADVASVPVGALPPEGQELPIDQKVVVGTPMMIAPGTTTLTLEITFGRTDGQSSQVTATASLKEPAKPGTAYRITLELSNEDTPQPITAEATIDEWIEGEGGNATVE